MSVIQRSTYSRTIAYFANTTEYGNTVSIRGAVYLLDSDTGTDLESLSGVTFTPETWEVLYLFQIVDPQTQGACSS